MDRAEHPAKNESADVEYVAGRASITKEGVGEIYGYAIREEGRESTVIFSSVVVNPRP